MKKKNLLIVMSLCIMLLAGGCNNKNKTSEEETSGAPTPTGTVSAEPETVALVKGEYVLSEYIKLGKYKGIEVTVEQLKVADADIEAAIEEELIANSTDEEITGRAVETGDIVNIDYEGLKDGVAFEGGTAAAFDLTIGSGSFIPGFEDQLIGTNIGDKVELDITFPEDYTSEELAGQPVVFKVTVNTIKKTVVPELTEEYVKANTDFKTIDAYKANIKESLQAENVETMKTTKTNNVFSAIVDDSEISSCPQTLIDYYSTEMTNYYVEYAATYGMDFAAFLTASQMTEEDFKAKALEYATSWATQELVLNAIIEAEKLELTDEEYQVGITDIVSEYGYASEEELFEAADKEQLKESLLWQKTMDFVTEQAVEL